jgi:hypothetical protein
MTTCRKKICTCSVFHSLLVYRVALSRWKRDLQNLGKVRPVDAHEGREGQSASRKFLRGYWRELILAGSFFSYSWINPSIFAKLPNGSVLKHSAAETSRKIDASVACLDDNLREENTAHIRLPTRCLSVESRCHAGSVTYKSWGKSGWCRRMKEEKVSLLPASFFEDIGES